MDEYNTEALKRIGQAVEYAMKERGYNISTLSEASGVARNSIYKIIRGENYAITILIEVLRILQVHIEMSLMTADNNIHTMAGNKPSKN